MRGRRADRDDGRLRTVTQPLPIDGERLWQRLMSMAEIGATPAGGSNRQALTDEDHEGRELLVEWASAAGCTIARDPVGNLFATRAGGDPTAPPVVLGSHLDTQPTGGRFDGVYGVLGGLEVIESLADNGISTDVPVAVAVWTNEEGARFPVSMMGSAVWVGAIGLDRARRLTDADGVTVGEELDRLGWSGPMAFGRDLGAYLELHIEQGPVLEQSGAEIGIVTGVQGFRWLTLTISGRAAHAGSTPMEARRDPSRVVAEILGAVYRIADERAPQARMTPAQLRSHPSSPNTVPAQISLSLDVRNPRLDVLDEMERAVRTAVEDAAERHGCEVSIRLDNDSPPVLFDAGCVAAVESAAALHGFQAERIVSGAGHDACYVARHNPVGMIFIPCRDGISHNEAESIEPEAAAAGAAVLYTSALALANADEGRGGGRK